MFAHRTTSFRDGFHKFRIFLGGKKLLIWVPLSKVKNRDARDRKFKIMLQKKTLGV